METIISTTCLSYSPKDVREAMVIDKCDDNLRDTISKCIATRKERCYSYHQEFIMFDTLYALCKKDVGLFAEVLDEFREVIDDDNLNDIEYGDINYSLLDEFLKRRVK